MEEEEIAKASYKTIIDCLAEQTPLKILFDTDDHTTIFCQNFLVTFDYDCGYCRIHTNQWELKAAIDIAKYCASPQICSKMILDRLTSFNNST